MNPAQAMGIYAAQLGNGLSDVQGCLGRAQAEGLDIPVAAVRACQVLAALGTAWATNSQGYAAPDEAKQLLGLIPTQPHAI